MPHGCFLVASRCFMGAAWVRTPWMFLVTSWMPPVSSWMHLWCLLDASVSPEMPPTCPQVAATVITYKCNCVGSRVSPVYSWRPFSLRKVGCFCKYVTIPRQVPGTRYLVLGTWYQVRCTTPSNAMVPSKPILQN